jgi:hypothetical protein
VSANIRAYMTPSIAAADFTGFTPFLVASFAWAMAALLSIGALILAFPARTRTVSAWLALGCVIAWPVCIMALLSEVAVLHSRGEHLWQKGDPFWRELLLVCLPMIIAAAGLTLSRKPPKPRLFILDAGAIILSNKRDML